MNASSKKKSKLKNIGQISYYFWVLALYQFQSSFNTFLTRNNKLIWCTLKNFSCKMMEIMECKCNCKPTVKIPWLRYLDQGLHAYLDYAQVCVQKKLCLQHHLTEDLGWHLLTRDIYDRVWNRKNYFGIAAFLNFECGTLRVGISSEN